MKPFFSVCISSLNRENTIFRTLESLTKQIFKDFEVIIVDCGSQDKTNQEIKKFFESSIYKKNKFKYIYKFKKIKIENVEDWNEPLKYSKGKYTLMLEGDDYIKSNFLMDAWNIISKNDNIGIYATGNQNNKRKKTGFFKPRVYLKYLMQFEELPPPSETIFITKNKNKKYYYNIKEYVYCPEYDLYIRIVKDGFSAYHDDKKNTYRNPTNNRKKGIGENYYSDYKIIEKKYGNLVNKNTLKKRKENIITKKTIYAIKDMIQEKKLTPFFRKTAKEVGFFRMIYLFIKWTRKRIII